MTNWQAIKADYEQGLSLRVLAEKHQISKSMIHKKATGEKWTVSTKNSGHSGGQWTPPVLDGAQTPTSVISAIAQAMLKQLGDLTEHPLTEIKDHKLFADALSQYSKIFLAGQADQPLQGSIEGAIPKHLLPYMTNEELQGVERLVALLEQRYEQAEQDRETLERKRM